jgi:hypothetical protein
MHGVRRVEVEFRHPSRHYDQLLVGDSLARCVVLYALEAGKVKEGRREGCFAVVDKFIIASWGHNIEDKVQVRRLKKNWIHVSINPTHPTFGRMEEPAERWLRAHGEIGVQLASVL